MNKEYSAQTNVNLPVSVLKKIDEMAKENKTSRSAIIRYLLIKCLEADSVLLLGKEKEGNK